MSKEREDLVAPSKTLARWETGRLFVVPGVLLTGRRRKSTMVGMKEGRGIAEVTQVIRHPTVKVAEGTEIRVFTIGAKMQVPAHKYSQDLFRVKVLKPTRFAFASLQCEEGSLMEHGEFEFDAVAEPKVGDKLEISISLAT